MKPIAWNPDNDKGLDYNDEQYYELDDQSDE